MPINAGPEFIAAERKYYQAATLEEKIAALQEMIRTAPKHKGSENLLAELKTRLKKFLQKQEKAKTVGKSSIKTIRKEGFQCVLAGLPNTGKSTILATITNATPLITPHPFATKNPEVGTFDFEGVKAQIVDLPSIGTESFDIGIVNTADLILIVINNLIELTRIEPLLNRSSGKKLVIINKIDQKNDDERRKLEETIKSKKLNAITISCATKENITKLKEKILSMMNVARIYLKEPSKPPSNIPLVIHENATVKEVAEHILKGFWTRIKETRITGPSSKFPNQKVGLTHIVKDKDIVEFHTN